MDLVILDISMPGGNGLTVGQLLAVDDELKSIPVIMVTGNADQEFMDKAQARGAVEYVVKPFDYDVLLDKIAKILS